MWIDTHTHFDHKAFDNTRQYDWEKARALGVSAQFMMGVSPANFTQLEQLADNYAGTYFALGIHPFYVMQFDLDDAIKTLRKCIEKNLSHPRFIGIGEIGLDTFVKPPPLERQMDFFIAQLSLAKEYHLPVFLHARKTQDIILKQLRRFSIEQGIAHAFNGSEQQAHAYIKQGFKLGFGGAFTFERAKKLRRLIRTLPIEAFVLETDCPDMSPAWNRQKLNHSYHLPRIGEAFAEIRGISINELAKQIKNNSEHFVKNANNKV